MLLGMRACPSIHPSRPLLLALLLLLLALPLWAGQSPPQDEEEVKVALDLIRVEFYRGEKFDPQSRVEGGRLDGSLATVYSVEVSVEVFRPGRVEVRLTLEPSERGPRLSAKKEIDARRGIHRLRFPGLINLASFGDEIQPAVLKVEVAGERGEKISRRIHLELKGPEPPWVRITDLFIIPDNVGPMALLEPGEEFSLHIFYEVMRNPAGVEPTLRVIALVDRSGFDPTDRLDPDQWWEEKRVPGRPGIYEVVVRGIAPAYFRNPGRRLHRLEIYAVMWYGADRPRLKRQSEIIYDQLANQSRRPFTDSDTLPFLDQRKRWKVRPLTTEEYFNRLDELEKELSRLDRERENAERWAGGGF